MASFGNVFSVDQQNMLYTVSIARKIIRISKIEHAVDTSFGLLFRYCSVFIMFITLFYIENQCFYHQTHVHNSSSPAEQTLVGMIYFFWIFFGRNSISRNDSYNAFV
jgi:hypothetical protein